MTFYIENEKLDVDEFMTLDPSLEFFAEALKKYSSEIRDAQVNSAQWHPPQINFRPLTPSILVCTR